MVLKKIVCLMLACVMLSCQSSMQSLNHIEVAAYNNYMDVWRNGNGDYQFSPLSIDPIYIYFRRNPQIAECYNPFREYSVFKYWQLMGDTICFSEIKNVSVIPDVPDYVDVLGADGRVWLLKDDKLLEIINFYDTTINYHRCDTAMYKLIYSNDKKKKWYESVK